ncbi:unnamed protein product [Ixodes persulcatus]
MFNPLAFLLSIPTLPRLDHNAGRRVRNDHLFQLYLKVDQLADELANLPSAQQQTLRGRNPQRGFTRSSRPRSSSAPRTCWFSAKFGIQAQKCQTPCSFAENESVTRPLQQAW